MAPTVRTLAALALLLPAALAGQPKSQTQPKPQTSLRALPRQDGPSLSSVANLLAPDTGAAVPVMIVPMPVVEVVVIDGRDQVSHNSTADKIEEECANQMKALMQDQQRMERSQKCEKSTQHAQNAMKQLEVADQKGAEGHVEKLFTECAELSPQCAKQMAPDIVLKMRLSGVAITDKCVETGKTVMGQKPTDPQMACQEKTVKGMAQELQSRNINGALTAAQKGLQECHKVEPPCDFQLAPIVLMDLLQQAAGAGMEEQQPEPEPEMPEIALGLLAKSQATRKLSLLDVATRVRVTSRSVKLRA